MAWLLVFLGSQGGRGCCLLLLVALGLLQGLACVGGRHGSGWQGLSLLETDQHSCWPACLPADGFLSSSSDEEEEDQAAGKME